MNDKIQHIREYGYCKLESVFDADTVALALETVKYLFSIQETSGEVPRLNEKNRNLYNIQNKSLSLLRIVLDPVFEPILINLLNDDYYPNIPKNLPNYTLRASGARSSDEAIPFHIDSFIPFKGDYPLTVQVAIFLEDSTIWNGCTLIKPGTHQSGTYASNDYSARPSIAVVAKAGDVVMWDGRTHHATAQNSTSESSFRIVSTFSRWFTKPQFNVTDRLPINIYNGLDPKERAILGFSSVSPYDETHFLDLKRGYYV